jgi:malate dehydrogenase
MTRDDLFAINAGIVADTMKQAAESCPDATFLIISNPVNSTVPIASEVLKHYNVYNPKKLFGVTSLDLCRAETFVAENLGQNIDDTVVPVVGGHAGTTIVPLLSQSGGKFTDADRDALTQRIMFGGDEVVQAKAGGGSATLSMAYAGARMTESVLLALDGEYIEEFAFVESDLGIAPFFSSRVTLDKTGGVSEISPVKDITDYEQQLIDDMKEDLNAQVAKGIQFGKDYAAKQ